MLNKYYLFHWVHFDNSMTVDWFHFDDGQIVGFNPFHNRPQTLVFQLERIEVHHYSTLCNDLYLQADISSLDIEYIELSMYTFH